MERSRTAVAVIFLAAPMPRDGAWAAAKDTPRQATSTEGDRTSAEITVYNVGLGLVKDRRNVTLPAGETTLLFTLVPGAPRGRSLALDWRRNAGVWTLEDVRDR